MREQRNSVSLTNGLRRDELINESGSYSGENCPRISQIVIPEESGIKVYNPPMKLHPSYPFILSLALLLSACVPIPATAPETTAPVSNLTPAPAADTKAGFSDLASALAKADESDDIQQYAQLLDEFARLHASRRERRRRKPGILQK